VQQLDAADGVPLSIVVGAPGSGKTSLLSQWYHAFDSDAIAWMSADAGDADPTRFWRGCIRALQQLHTGFGTEADDLISLDGGVTADTLESLLDDDHRLRGRIRLVIDDFHLVSLDAAQQLQHLLQRGLRGVRIVIGSRSDPAVGLHRLRLEGSVCEIRDAALRFDLDEARACAAKLGVDTAALDLVGLYDRTEGWVAGVQMAALSLVGADDPAARAAEIAGNTQTIAGYLIGEVLASQTARIRRFLENTCVATDLDADLCRALMADEPVDVEPVTLEEIESLHLLLTRVDAEGTVFRYHQLFGELLRSMLLSRDPDRLRHQHSLAARHLEQRGRVIDAIHHHSHAGHRAVAARMVGNNAIAVLLSTGPPPPVDLHRDITDEEIVASPTDAVGYALTFVMNGRPDLAQGVLQRADAVLAASTIAVVDRSHLHCVRIGAELQFGESATAVRHVEQMLRLIDDEGAPIDHWVAASLPSWLRACAWEGRFDLADRVQRTVPPPPNPVLARVDLAGAIALLDLERGAVSRCVDSGQRIRDDAVALGVAGGGADLAARSVLGVALLEQGNLAAASVELSTVLGSAFTERLPSLAYASIGMARSLRCEARFDEAFAALALARLRCVHPRVRSAHAERIDLAEIDLLVASGDLAAATSLAEQLDDGWRAETARARIDIAAGRTSAASERIATLSPQTPRQQFAVAVTTLAIALASGAPTDTIEQRACEVLDVAEPLGMVLPIGEAGTDVLRVAVAASRRRERTEFIERLLGLQPLPLPTSLATPRSKADVLSSRELVVLRYMATSMSNQEIADELYVSVNTVKTHIKHVLRKLAATSRTHAVQQARAAKYL
jgi:LuxR family maltose regulon positive regulatory protein